MDYLTYLDLHKNELRNAVLHPLVVAPSSPTEGQFYYNSVEKKAYQYNGATWVPLGELNVIETIVVNGTALTPSSKTVNITVPTDLGDLTNEAGYIKQADIPEGAAASSTTPSMDGTAWAGSETAFARGDHVHPTDTSRLAANLKGAAGGVAELDQNGKVPSSQLPSYVDDIIEGYFYDGAFYEEVTHTTEITGESGKVYSDLATNKLYRWGGSAYAEISASLALGETSSTAYRGDRGKAAYDHSQVTSGNPHNVTASDVGLGNVDNTSDATKKTNFTGSIAYGDTGFVTGDDAYDALALKLDKAGGTMSGDIAMGSNKITGLAAPTADGDAANKAYVDGALPTAATAAPLMDGTAAVGSGTKWAKEDHVHPTDTSRAPLVSPAFTGTPTAPTAAAGTDTTQIATTAFVKAAIDAGKEVFWAQKDVTTCEEIAVALAANKTVAMHNGDYIYGLIMAASNGDNRDYIFARIGSGSDHVSAWPSIASIGCHGEHVYNEADVSYTLVTTWDSSAHYTSLAPIVSPTLTGTPTAPTADSGTNTTQIATTAFVQSAVGGLIKTATGTIETSATSASVSYTGTLINTYATMGGEIIGLDIDVSTSGTVIFSTATTPPSAVTCVVVYA